MPKKIKNYENKPYYKCVSCEHLGIICDGPNFLTMSPEEWCEWSRARKEYLGWTNAYVTEGTDISQSSVERVMAGNANDLRRTTMQAVTKRLINGSWGENPCALAALSREGSLTYVDNPVLVERCIQLEKTLDNTLVENQRKIDYLQREIAFLQKELDFANEQINHEEQHLNERYGFMKRKDRIITILSILLGIAVLGFIIALVIDVSNHHIGFFWLKEGVSEVLQKVNLQ